MNNEWKDGLPPVGAECEVSNNNQDFVWCEIRYIGEKICVVDHKTHIDQPYYLKNVKFRPIKSEADKLRDEQHNLIVEVIEAKEYDDIDECAEALYKAGCRMTRELTPEVVEMLARKTGAIINPKTEPFAKAIAAYVRGDSATGE